MKTKKRAVIYARVSSENDRQDTTRQIKDLESKKEGKQNIGWYRIRLNNTIVRFQAIHIRAIEVIEDNDYKTWFFKNRKFIRYEVKPNPWHIEFLEFRRGEGFVAIGKKMDLLRKPPLYEMVNV